MTADRSNGDVRVERRGSALWITLARPEAFNALTSGSIAAIDEALDRVDADLEIRSLVVTGSGTAFCAGADLKAVLAADQGGVCGTADRTTGRARLHGAGSDAAAVTRHFLRQVNATFNRLASLRVPTVAAVNGTALAGGLELMLCCDVAIAAASAKLGDAHANFGQIPGGGGSRRLPRRIGASRAKWLMFTGQSIDAATASAWGLVDEVCAPDDLTARVDALTDRMAQKSALVLERMKTLVDAEADSSAAVALDAERLLSEWHLSSHDRNEGLAAFSEKRQPHYIGR